MSARPSNTHPIIADRIFRSDSIALSASSGQTDFLFVDDLFTWQIESVHVVPTTNYIISQAASVALGIPGTLAKFVPSTSLGTAAITAYTVKDLTSVLATKVLPPGTPLVASWTQNASQTGAVRFVVRLRPQQPNHVGNKAPATATATV